MANLQAIIVSALVLGSLYALTGAGLSVVWGTLRFFNFTHGSLMMLAAYVAWTISRGLGGRNIWTALLVTLPALMGVAWLLELTLVRPFLGRRLAELLALITTLAGASLLENLVQVIWGPRFKQLPPVLVGDQKLLGLAISRHEVVMILTAPLLLLLVSWALSKTRVGLAIRAVEQNHGSALLMGINVRHIYAVTFALAGALATVAGVLLGALHFMTPTMGGEPLLKSFIVVIFGGSGSFRGTILSAYVIGLIEAASTFFVGLYWTPVVLFLAMTAVLLIRPSGLFGVEV